MPPNHRRPWSVYATHQAPWSGPPLHPSSSEEAQLSPVSGSHFVDQADWRPSSSQTKNTPQRRPSNRAEFDGPSQLLDKPHDGVFEVTEEDLPQLPTTLHAAEQDAILSEIHARLSQCAFDFVAKYQFPIPIEPHKPRVRSPSDREWCEWVYLLKRFATKRRIPARVLYGGQIRQLTTVLENSLDTRASAAAHMSRVLKDDRNVLQLISAGLQVARMLKDGPAMRDLDALYVRTEGLIVSRRMSDPVALSTGLRIA